VSRRLTNAGGVGAMSGASARPSGPPRQMSQPPWWCHNRHVQTLWGPLVRGGRLAATRERFQTRDGDFVDLDWAEPRATSGAPLLLILHGLEGSSRSHYVRGLAGHARARSWNAVALNFRSCSGETNRLARFYHSGETGDLHDVVAALIAREPESRIVMAGVSLGGNVLLKWLGELEHDTPQQIVAAAGISVPFYLAPCARALDRGVERMLYTAAFMRSLKRKVLAKAALHPGFVDVAAALRARTFAEYDRIVTAPLGGFADEVDYWTRASSGPYLARIRRPTLTINALDDPFIPPDSLPPPLALGPYVRMEVTTWGSHGGFIDGRWPWAVGSWAERRAVRFLASALDSASSSASPDYSRTSDARAGR
jgi:predicted alpha/beta-fold hydrolase